VGAALLGLSVGQGIDWRFPDGRIRHLRVEELLFQPESYFSAGATG
jgi:regulator of nucleoside diphosphate kinase